MPHERIPGSASESLRIAAISRGFRRTRIQRLEERLERERELLKKDDEIVAAWERERDLEAAATARRRELEAAQLRNRATATPK